MDDPNVFSDEKKLIRKIFAQAKLTPLFEDRPLRSGHYVQIKCKEYHNIMLRIMNGEFFSYNKPALNLRKVKLPLTEAKLGELKRKLLVLKDLQKKLARTNIKKFMGDLLDWTTHPNKQEAIVKLLQYKKIVAQYAKHDGPVFRGVVLSKSEFNDLKAGRPHVYTRPSSWADNLRTAQRYAKGYSNTRMLENGDRVGVVFKLDAPKVLFNVPAFVKANPNIVALAEANIYADHLETGSLYESEIITAPIALTYGDIVWSKKS